LAAAEGRRPKIKNIPKVFLPAAGREKTLGIFLAASLELQKRL